MLCKNYFNWRANSKLETNLKDIIKLPTGNICLEILKSDLFAFLTRFSRANESLKVWNIFWRFCSSVFSSTAYGRNRKTPLNQIIATFKSMHGSLGFFLFLLWKKILYQNKYYMQRTIGNGGSGVHKCVRLRDICTFTVHYMHYLSSPAVGSRHLWNVLKIVGVYSSKNEISKCGRKDERTIKGFVFRMLHITLGRGYEIMTLVMQNWLTPYFLHL